jgi:hypothetical protein
MPEIVGTFVGAKTWDEGANSSTQRWDGPGGDLAQVSLEFAEGHLGMVARLNNFLTDRRHHVGRELAIPTTQSTTKLKRSRFGYWVSLRS